MAKYVCSVCGYEYDETLGDPDNGIAPGTKWEDIPEDFLCPLCGVGKDQLKGITTTRPAGRVLPFSGEQIFFRQVLKNRAFAVLS